MRSILNSLIAVIIALTSILLLVLFYSHQNEFSNHYKQILSDLHNLDSTEHKLTYNILQNTLYLYSNQDSISQNRQQLSRAIDALQSHTLMQESSYQNVLEQLQKLSTQSDEYYYQLDSFLSLNAGIKNSFIYINTHAYEAIIKEKHDPNIIRTSQYISKAFVTAGRTLDSDLLIATNARIEKLQEYNKNLKKSSRAIGLFLLHVRFISENFPAYIETLNHLLSSPLLADITKISEDFTSIATQDIEALNRFALLLMTLFIISIISISFLLIRLRHENLKLEKTQDELNNSLIYDHLTGLRNRFSFEKELRHFQHPTLILFNIDNFKHVNDFYGIEIGNFVLKECAQLLKDVTLNRFDEQIFRLGGDDFGIIIEDVSLEAAQHNAETIIHAIDSHIFSINNLVVSISVSAAISDQAPLIENADMSLKYIKTIANEHLIIYSEELGLKESVSKNLNITNTLKEAIKNDFVVPYFQPIFHLEHKKIEKYEALVRIESADGTILQPWQFLPTAVKTSYYADITRIMIQKSMAYFKDLPYRFSVNLAMQDLLNKELMEVIKATLEDDKETAKRLDFELLESEHISDIDLVNRFIHDIKAYGCRISIDDFGSGYSNFSYLLRLDIDIIKIDGSLIKEINTNPKSYRIVKTIVEFASINTFDVVAEFVEDQAIAECLQTLGITYAQGYYYGKPRPDTL
ncbi:MAG: EAL domain-containing protein [Campylobacterota bacterium]|nr:EAL domain-containing protein [Campylobacterota bacterium]